MHRTVVGILRGGTSSEYTLSLKTGAAMMAALPEENYETRDIFIDKQGYWHVRGVPVSAARALAQVDVVLNGLHGGVGEDGTVQRILERAGVAYAGARALPSSFALNKLRSKRVFTNAGLPMAHGIAFSTDNEMTTGDMARFVFEQFAPPYIVKPANEGASFGLKYAATIIDLPSALEEVLNMYGAALVEEYLIGEEVQVGIIENFRGEEVYALPPVHVILPKEARFFESSHHEGAIARHIVPSNFSHSEKQAIADLAKAAHRALELKDFSRADIILTKHGPYLLEVNAYPGLYAGAALPPALESVGSSTRQFLEHSIARACR